MNKLFIATFALLGAMTLNAQPRQGGNENPEDRQAKREAFTKMQAQEIARELAFDEATTAKFIDTYLACQKEIWAIGPGKKPLPGKDNSLTEAEAKEANKAQFERNERILVIRRKYYDEYSKFLSQKQIQRVYEIEKQMHGKMAGHGRKGGPGRGAGRGPERGPRPGGQK